MCRCLVMAINPSFLTITSTCMFVSLCTPCLYTSYEYVSMLTCTILIHISLQIPSQILLHIYPARMMGFLKAFSSS